MDFGVKVVYLFGVKLKGSWVFDVGKGKYQSENYKRVQGRKITQLFLKKTFNETFLLAFGIKTEIYLPQSVIS